jgi:hypothetical protein
MEPNASPTPEPSPVTPEPPDASPTNITTQANDPRLLSPPETQSVRGSSVPVFMLTSVVLLGTCVLGALLGSWVLIVFGLIAALFVFHYFAWGWTYSRMVAQQQKEELLKLAEQDTRSLPDPMRSRHL